MRELTFWQISRMVAHLRLDMPGVLTVYEDRQLWSVDFLEQWRNWSCWKDGS